MLKASKHEASSKMSVPLRVQVDDLVDRLQVEVQRCMEPSSTNYPKASFFSLSSVTSVKDDLLLNREDKAKNQKKVVSIFLQQTYSRYFLQSSRYLQLHSPLSTFTTDDKCQHIYFKI